MIGTDHTGYQADHVGFLNIASVSVETDAGDWKCEACNPIGCDSSSISLLVEGKNIYVFIHSFIHSFFLFHLVSYLISFHFHMDILMDRWNGESWTV